MTWLKLPDDWSNRPDILALSAEAFRLHVGGMSHAMKHLTDRVIARHVVSMLAPGYRPRMVEDLEAAGLWRPFPDGSGWWIADAAMDEQPTRAEVTGEREATAARQDLSRARKAKDPAAEHKATLRADAARAAIAAAKEEKRLHAGLAPWEWTQPEPVPAPPPEPTPEEPSTPPVTGDVTRDVTGDQHRESQRPDPTRPGEPTVLSGPEAGGTGAASGPVLSFRDRGILPPPGPRPGGRLRPPEDEELARQHAALLSDPRCADELRRYAVDSLRSMGREDLIPAGVNGR